MLDLYVTVDNRSPLVPAGRLAGAVILRHGESPTGKMLTYRAYLSMGVEPKAGVKAAETARTKLKMSDGEILAVDVVAGRRDLLFPLGGSRAAERVYHRIDMQSLFQAIQEWLACNPQCAYAGESAEGRAEIGGEG